MNTKGGKYGREQEKYARRTTEHEMVIMVGMSQIIAHNGKLSFRGRKGDINSRKGNIHPCMHIILSESKGIMVFWKMESNQRKNLEGGMETGKGRRKQELES